MIQVKSKTTNEIVWATNSLSLESYLTRIFW